MSTSEEVDKKFLKDYVKDLLNPKENQLTDVQLGDLFRKKTKSVFVFNPMTDFWFQYNQNHWEKTFVEYLKIEILDFIKNENINIRITDGYLNSTIHYLRSTLKLKKNVEWDNQNHLLPFKDVCLDISKNLLKEHTPSIYNRLLYPYEIAKPYQEIQDYLKEKNLDTKKFEHQLLLYKEKCPRIAEFLDTAFPDIDFKKVAYRLIQALILRLEKLECFFLLLGPSNTGKSTFLSILEKFVGADATISLPFKELTTTFGLVDLAKRCIRLITVAEGYNISSNNPAANNIQSRIKSMTSSDTMMIQNKFVQAAYECFKGLLVIAANEPLFDSQAAEGILNKRLLTLPMRHKISLSNNVDYVKTIPDSEFANFYSLSAHFYSGLKAKNELREEIMSLRGSENMSKTNQETIISSFQDPLSLYLVEEIEVKKDAYIPLKTLTYITENGVEKKLKFKGEAPALRDKYVHYLAHEGFEEYLPYYREFTVAVYNSLRNLYPTADIQRVRKNVTSTRGTKHKKVVFTNLAYKQPLNPILETQKTQEIPNNPIQEVPQDINMPSVVKNENINMKENQIQQGEFENKNLSNLVVEDFQNNPNRYNIFIDKNFKSINGYKISLGLNGETPDPVFVYNTPEHLDSYVLDLFEPLPEDVSVDIETNGVSVHREHKIYSLQICFEKILNNKTQRWVLIFCDLLNWERLAISNQSQKNMRFLMAKIHETLLYSNIYLFNGIFDLIGIQRFLKSLSWNENKNINFISKTTGCRFMDPYLLATYCFNRRKESRFDLESGLDSLSLNSLCKFFLDISLNKDFVKKPTGKDELIDWKSMIKDNEILAYHYMALDIIVLQPLWDVLGNSKYLKLGMLHCYKRAEGQFLPVFSNMSEVGICIDIEQYHQQKKEKETILSAKTKEFFWTYTGKDKLIDRSFFPKNKYKIFNENEHLLNTNKEDFEQFVDKMKLSTQKKILMSKIFECLKMPYPVVYGKTKEKYAFNETVLNQLSDTIAEEENNLKIKEYRLSCSSDLKALKNLETTCANLKNQIKLYRNQLHCMWVPFGTAIGRITTRNPNLQGINRDHRNFMIAKEGHLLVVADLSTIELRLLAEATKDVKLLDEFSKPDADVHRLTASLLFKKDPQDISKEERQIGKGVNFGLSYGNTAVGLFDQLKYNARISNLTFDKVKEYHSNWTKSYPGVGEWSLDQLTYAKNFGHVPNPYGRSRLWKKKKISLDTHKFNSHLNQAANFPIQSGCLEIIYDSLIYLQAKSHSLLESTLALVHDEIVLQVPKDSAEEAKQILIECMGKASVEYFKTLNPNSERAKLPYEILVEANISSSWAK